MTLLTVVRDVCAVVGVVAPTSVFASINTNRTMFEMVANANEMAQRIAYDTRDWQQLVTQQFMRGDGHTEALDLPANYKRMLLTSNIYKLYGSGIPLLFISDLDTWLREIVTNETHSEGAWTLYGGQIHFRPFLGRVDANGDPQPASETILFNYLDKNCIKLASGGFGDRFVQDEDTFRLDERLLKLGMIYNWKMQKGSPFAEDMGTYSDAIANEMGHNQPAPILMGRTWGDARYANGW
jgi:hypothetical protein